MHTRGKTNPPTPTGPISSWLPPQISFTPTEVHLKPPPTPRTVPNPLICGRPSYGSNSASPPSPLPLVKKQCCLIVKGKGKDLRSQPPATATLLTTNPLNPGPPSSSTLPSACSEALDTLTAPVAVQPNPSRGPTVSSDKNVPPALAGRITPTTVHVVSD